MVKQTLIDISQALKLANISYIVIGGQAVLLYGEPRMTQDIDITLGADIDQCGEILSTLDTSLFEPLVKDPRNFAKETRVLPIRHLISGIRIDLIFSFTSYEREAITRARTVTIDGHAISYCSVEDLIIHKMVAGRARDLEDVKGILLRQRQVNHEAIISMLLQFQEVIHRNLISDYAAIRESLTWG